MINKIDTLIDILDNRNDFLFLSNENDSWTYSELSKAIKRARFLGLMSFTNKHFY